MAPYVLTSLIDRPQRLIYVVSRMDHDGRADLSDPQWERHDWDGVQAYSDSKLFVAVLAAEVARRWRAVYSNAMEPGWVATSMGGEDATVDLSLAPVTQAWLATSDEVAATTTGGYFFHQRPASVHPAAANQTFADELLAYGESLCGHPIRVDL